MTRCSCRTEQEIRRILYAVRRGVGRPILLFVCVACGLTQASSVPVVVMDGNVYCESDAFKRAKLDESALTTDEFRRRLRPYAGVSQLRRYDSIPAL